MGRVLDDPPWNAACEAIPAKLAVQPELLIVAVDHDVVVGPVMPGYDGHRGWLYALAVLNSYRCRRLGYDVEERVSMGKRLQS